MRPRAPGARNIVRNARITIDPPAILYRALIDRFLKVYYISCYY